MKHYPLTIELVPKTAWYTNVRSNVSKEEWNCIRKKSYQNAGYVCEICGDTGLNQNHKHPVECHEIWQYDDLNHIQKLTGLISLCPNCHTVKHSGLATTKGKLETVIRQLQKVNSMTFEEATEYLQESFLKWIDRSQHEWTLDIEYLKTY